MTAASHFGVPNRCLASAYIITATSRPMMCCDTVTSAKLWKGLSTHR